MKDIQALQIAYNELSQLTPCEENKDIFEAVDVIEKMIHKKKMQQIKQQIKQNAKRHQLNDKPHNALGITELNKIYAEHPDEEMKMEDTRKCCNPFPCPYEGKSRNCEACYCYREADKEERSK